ncbi:poly [ADP-ribose] polymerase 2 isoform X2 [Magnolia sinica]|uniref:poly [ADP-ribose] polymerase 2 isoform X2 n=1 Tax=Magnolia sinica TaxID=86752 RepID=UPI00265AC5B8|nr:poly [ADP-ribose] polymerase 2 isoform X2 [Magnolia sinica]
MSSRLKVDDIRTLLAQRGLDTSGTKLVLLKRLESACSNDGNSSSDVVGKKRPRRRPNEDGAESQKVDSVETISGMGIQQLREQAALHGVSASGSKKDLVKRICAAIKEGLDDVPEESDDGGTFLVYNRWGRVGVKGQDKLHGPYTSCDGAINEFQQKFFDKTKNQWLDRKEFICYPKCYTWLEMDYSEAEKAVVCNKPNGSIIGSQLRETRLEPRLAKFISLICNISMMKQQMLEIGYNAEKLPLGKLSKSTILKGYDVLKRISDVIGQSDRKKLELLSGEFYTVIPHDFGFRKMRDFVIDTPVKLKSKLEMVEALGEIEVASKLLKDDNDQDDPLYSHYQHLHCELTPLEVDSEEFSMIEKYMKNTHAKTHSNYTVDIVQIFKASREVEAERFRKFSSMKNRMLLWHGSRLTNWTGILSQGLRIAPPEAPSTGYMFGKGVYFADMFSKSANYCYSTKACRVGVLLLCEVALGDMAELLSENYNADKLPKGKLSTKGVGATAPDPSEFQTLEDGVVVPLGKPTKHPVPECSLGYNEYIVYNVDQIRMQYVVQVNFNYKQ